MQQKWNGNNLTCRNGNEHICYQDGSLLSDWLWPHILRLVAAAGACFIFVADAAGEFFVMWRNFRYREILHVALHGILSQNLFYRNLRCFVVKPVLLRFTHFPRGEKFSLKCCLWRKNDKYNVWAGEVADAYMHIAADNIWGFQESRSPRICKTIWQSSSLSILNIV